MAKKIDTEEVSKEIVKKKPRGKNIAETLAPIVEPGDNSKYLGFTMMVGNLPTIDLHNAEQVQGRLQEYFQLCFDSDMKPAVSGMALALGNGITRQTLWAIKAGQPVGGNGYMTTLPTEVADCIKKAYSYMEILWENYMQNGKINPVSGIFLGKNNYGYQDKTEYVVTPNVNNDSDYDADAIKKRYLTDSTTLPLDSENDS
jgi:hypothetical protein